jgi:hypothetical protein
MQPKAPVRYARKVVQLGILAVFIGVGLNYNYFLDQYALRTYQPNAQLGAFDSRIELTTNARAKLYRSNPRFDDKTTFNSDCNTQPHELELGCYFRGRIFILQIDNTSLAPEMDVVGAHELLHAAWSTMNTADRAKLTPELERIYHGLNDKDLNDRMASYAQTEPGEEANELHSILGTEYTILSPVLETYYGQYFLDRSKVTSQHAAFQSVFDSHRIQLERDLALIRSKKAQLSVINHQMEAYRSNEQIQAYNALVPKQNQLVDDINSRITVYQSAVDEYNALSKSLDSQAITDTEARAQ